MAVYPFELYVGRSRSVQLLFMIQHERVKFYDAQLDEIVFCQPFSKLKKLQKDRKSNLFRLIFVDQRPLICYSRFCNHIFRQFQLSLSSSISDASLNYVTSCILSSQLNPFEEKQAQIEIDFPNLRIRINNQWIKSQSIHNLSNGNHDLLVNFCFQNENLQAKFNDFTEARHFKAILGALLTYRDFPDDDVGIEVTAQFGELSVNKSILKV